MSPKSMRYICRLRPGGIIRIPLPTAKRLGIAPGDVLQWTVRGDGRSAEFKVQPNSETAPRRPARFVRQPASASKMPREV
jgi:bifunctional DNA-binding transcriptional regulator/antitoxin component of YhaV-PrlF toxin-antitoxin module